jgi:hypothetical protein
MNTNIVIQKIEELIRKVDSLVDTIKYRNNTKKKWMDKQETMKILKCSERTLLTLRDKKLLRYTNPLGGSKFFYLWEDVEGLLKKLKW